MSRKYFQVQIKSKDSKLAAHPKYAWYSPVSGMGTRHYVNGFVAGIKQLYPCPDVRIINYHTEEVIEIINGNSGVAMSYEIASKKEV